MNLPDNATSLYESLREQIVKGAMRPQGLSIFLYHGMLRGLQILSERPNEPCTSLSEEKKDLLLSSPISLDTTLIRLLANMVSYLQQPEAPHVC